MKKIEAKPLHDFRRGEGSGKAGKVVKPFRESVKLGIGLS